LAKTKGERYKCDTCGVVVLVEDSCGCETECLVCCEQPMKKVEGKTSKQAKPETKAKAVKKES